MRSILHKRSKIIHKTLTSHGFREPYQIIMDCTFARNAGKASIHIPCLESMLRGKCKLYIPDCQYKRYKKFLKERDLTGHCEIIKCTHEAKDKSCILNVIGPRNRNHYILATCDQELMGSSKRIRGLPVMKMINSGMHIDLREIKLIRTENHGTAADRGELKRLGRMFASQSDEKEGGSEDEDVGGTQLRSGIDT